MSRLNWAEVERTYIPREVGAGPRYAMKQAYHRGAYRILEILDTFEAKEDGDVVALLAELTQECRAAIEEPRSPRRH